MNIGGLAVVRCIQIWCRLQAGRLPRAALAAQVPPLHGPVVGGVLSLAQKLAQDEPPTDLLGLPWPRESESPGGIAESSGGEEGREEAPPSLRVPVWFCFPWNMGK